MVTSDTMLPSNTDRKPIVAIVGAGIGGLMLGILLDRQGVEFNIFERAKEVKPLGSAIALGANIMPLFKQLGIWDQFLEESKVFFKVDGHDDKGEYSNSLDFLPNVEMGGCGQYMVARPRLYDLLLRQIPQKRLHLGKKVLSFIQSEHGVMVRTSDNETHEADILIGADGAYSAVRQGLYADLKAEKKLPASDNVPLPFSTVCLVGQTKPLDPERFPDLKLDVTKFNSMLSLDTPYAWSSITSKQNTICWGVIQFLDKESSKLNDSFRASEWGPEMAEQMCKEVRHFAIPGAAEGAEPLTLGNLIDETPKELIAKVMLEEKVFDTWYSGRVALLGDACHKLNPSGGAGALNAMHDAVCIANWISVLPSTELKDVKEIFRQYIDERHPVLKVDFETSQMYRNTMGRDWKSKITRYMSKHIPPWLWRIALKRTLVQRPQLSFLPLIEDKGTVKPAYQASLQKTLKLAVANRRSTKAA